MNQSIAISAMPTLGSLHLTAARDLPFPLDATTSERLFTVGGRTAIFHGLRRLGVGTGDVVLAPAYCCGSEIDAIAKTGATVRFYRMGPSLVPDLDHCRTLATGARAMLVTHYLGFPQPIAEIATFARESGLLLIEDCAHALFAEADGRPVGCAGDLAIFSFVKTLPLPDGGAAVWRGSPGAPMPTLAQPPIRRIVGRTLFLAESGLGRTRPGLGRAVGALRQTARVVRKRASPSEGEIVTDREAQTRILELTSNAAGLGMSRLAHALVAHLPLSDMARLRQHNYAALAAGLAGVEGVRPLIEGLPPGAVPMGLPLVVTDVPALQRALAHQGIGTKAFWAYFHRDYPDAEFPDEARLKRSVLLLPVHQGLDEVNMDRIARAVAGALRR